MPLEYNDHFVKLYYVEYQRFLSVFNKGFVHNNKCPQNNWIDQPGVACCYKCYYFNLMQIQFNIVIFCYSLKLVG